MPETETCEGSGRVVSQRNRKRSIYTVSHGWVAYCPYHDGSAPCVTGRMPRTYAEHRRPR